MNAWVEFVQGPVVHRVGWTLCHFLWQGTLLALMWVMLRSLLRRQEARIRYLAACGIFGLMAAAPALTFVLLGNTEVPGLGAATIAPPPTVSAGIASAAPAAVIPAAFTLPRAAERLIEVLETAMPWLVSLWAAGVGALALRLLHGVWSVNRMTQCENTLLDPVWLARIEDLRRRLLIRWPVRLLVSAVVEVPTVAGWLRPVILFPVGALGGLTPNQLELILAHELAHIRRYDHWVNLFQVVVETLFFYHPAVWWLSGQIRTERELCCDDVAVQTCGDRVAYARALTALEALRGAGTVLALGADGGSLLGRVRHLLGLKGTAAGARPRRVFGSLLIGLGLLLFAAGVVCLALSPTQHIAACKVLLETQGLGPGPNYDPYFVQTEFERLRSSSTLGTVVTKLNLSSRWQTTEGPLLSKLKEIEARDGHDLQRAMLNAYPDADLSKLKQDLWFAEATLAKQRILYGDDHPEVRSLAAMQQSLAQKANERVEGIMAGLEVRVSAKAAEMQALDKAVQEAKEREVQQTRRYQPYFAAKRDLEDAQKIRDAILLRDLQENVDAQIPATQGIQTIERAVPGGQPVRRLHGLGSGLCLLGLLMCSGGFALRGLGRGEHSSAPPVAD